VLHIEVQRLGDIKPRAHKLIEIAFKHVSIFKAGYNVRPNWAYFDQFEKLGLLICLGVYDDAKLVGFACVIRSPSLHCAAVNLAIVNALYIHPKYRKKGVGLKSIGTLLVEEIELVAKALKCTHITFTVPKEEKRLVDLLIDVGYSAKELALIKRV
jgi:GNAT superfamily N-acetyltransferase